MQLAIAGLSERFFYGVDIGQSPLIEFVAVQILAGLLYLSSMLILLRTRVNSTSLIMMLVIGFGMRLLLFDTAPILEIDYYRYLWDGAVASYGENPYLLPPAQAADSHLAALALQSGPVIHRINYPELRTLYPPLTQLFFTLSHELDSWNLNAWRLLLLIADSAGLLWIAITLKTLQKPLHWCLTYWWNPVLLQQTYNATHMDVLLVAPLMAAVWALIQQRHHLSTLLLTAAAGIKLWPALLLPFVWRPLLQKPRQLISNGLLAACMLTLTVAPLLYFGLGEQSGLGSFARQWQRNSAIYPLLESTISLVSDHAALLARALVAGVIGGMVLWMNRSVITNPEIPSKRILWIIALLFLLSPAQFPWYTIWFLPLLCLHPSAALLLLTALMPIYYLKFMFIHQGQTQLFDHAIVWLQYLPVLGWLLIGWLVQRREAGRHPHHV